MNDAAVMRYMKARVVKLEQELQDAQRELNTLRLWRAPATEREEYVLGEMDIVNRQLESECNPFSRYGLFGSFWREWL